MAHLLEVATGFRSGDPFAAGAGRAEAGVRPGARHDADRAAARAKVAELAGAGAPEHARMLGLGRVSYRTLIRWENAPPAVGLIGCADDRWLREAAAIRASPRRSGRRSSRSARRPCSGSKISMRDPGAHDPPVRAGEVRRRRAGPQLPETLRPGLAGVVRAGRCPPALCPLGRGSRPTNGHVLVHRPGQVVALDTTRAAGDGPRERVRRPGEGAPHPRPGRLHALAGRVPAHAGLGHLGGRGDAAARRDDAAADARRTGERTWNGPTRASLPRWSPSSPGTRSPGLPFFTPETVTTDHGVGL